MDDAIGGLIGGLIVLGITFFVIIYIIIPGILIIVSATVSAGAVTGGWVSLRNYFFAFRDNVKPERITS